MKNIRKSLLTNEKHPEFRQEPVLETSAGKDRPHQNETPVRNMDAQDETLYFIKRYSFDDNGGGYQGL